MDIKNSAQITSFGGLLLFLNSLKKSKYSEYLSVKKIILLKENDKKRGENSVYIERRTS